MFKRMENLRCSLQGSQKRYRKTWTSFIEYAIHHCIISFHILLILIAYKFVQQYIYYVYTAVFFLCPLFFFSISLLLCFIWIFSYANYVSNTTVWHYLLLLPDILDLLNWKFINKAFKKKKVKMHSIYCNVITNVFSKNQTEL